MDGREKRRCPSCAGMQVKHSKTDTGEWIWLCLDCVTVTIQQKDGSFISTPQDLFDPPVVDLWPHEDGTWCPGDDEYKVFDA